MFNVLGDLNWLAIVLATIAYFVLGGLWFTPLFGKVYDTAMGFKRDKGYKWAPVYYVMPIISAAVVTFASAMLITVLDITQISDAVTFGIIVGTGYSASVSFNNAVNPKTPKPLLYGAVTGGYHVVGIILVSIILVSL